MVLPISSFQGPH
jgi:predicted NAD-dependent protein-ADP-ribosyltransferase YbiA (DUF1768 family)